jgi:hypothetical protein
MSEGSRTWCISTWANGQWCVLLQKRDAPFNWLWFSTWLGDQHDITCYVKTLLRCNYWHHVGIVDKVKPCQWGWILQTIEIEISHSAHNNINISSSFLNPQLLMYVKNPFRPHCLPCWIFLLCSLAFCNCITGINTCGGVVQWDSNLLHEWIWSLALMFSHTPTWPTSCIWYGCD